VHVDVVMPGPGDDEKICGCGLRNVDGEVGVVDGCGLKLLPCKLQENFFKNNLKERK
jgi:hypothetical protein